MYCLVHCDNGSTSDEDSDKDNSPNIEPKLIALINKILEGVDIGYNQYKRYQKQLEDIARTLKGTADEQFAGREKEMSVNAHQAKEEDNNADSFLGDLVSIVELRKNKKKILQSIGFQ